MIENYRNILNGYNTYINDKYKNAYNFGHSKQKTTKELSDDDRFRLNNFIEDLSSKVVPEVPEENSILDTSNQRVNIFDGWLENYSEPSTTQITLSLPLKKATAYSDRNLFISDLTKAYQAHNYNPELVKLMIAQDALETRWGEAPVGDFNFGNIKAMGWKEKTALAKDDEPGLSSYRSYNSLLEYIDDKVRLLKLYDITPDTTPEEAIKKLTGLNALKKKYATSSTYAQALEKIYKSM